jgi:hypothetical protein
VRRGRYGQSFQRRVDSFQVDSTFYHTKSEMDEANNSAAGANRSLSTKRVRKMDHRDGRAGIEKDGIVHILGVMNGMGFREQVALGHGLLPFSWELLTVVVAICVTMNLILKQTRAGSIANSVTQFVGHYRVSGPQTVASNDLNRPRSRHDRWPNSRETSTSLCYNNRTS